VAAITNTLVTGNMVGIREDLSNLISDISPTEVPFQASASKGSKPDNRFYEWQLDALQAVDTSNARNEGNDHTAFNATPQPTRVGNYCQISDKDGIFSGTSQAVKVAGRKSDKARAIIRRGLELRRDVEATVLQRNTGAASTDPRRTATMLSYVRTNVGNVVAGGANPAAPNPTYAGNRTDGTTPVAFTETMLKTTLATAFGNGMKIDGAVIMVDGPQKQSMSAFTGIATRYREVPKGQAAIVGAVDLYVSDFGELSIVANRFQRHRDAWILDFDLIRFRDLRPLFQKPLAPTGDADKFLLIREWSLQVDNEAGQALVADLA